MMDTIETIAVPGGLGAMLIWAWVWLRRRLEGGEISIRSRTSEELLDTIDDLREQLAAAEARCACAERRVDELIRHLHLQGGSDGPTG